MAILARRRRHRSNPFHVRPSGIHAVITELFAQR
jgi:hypothetical protein